MNNKIRCEWCGNDPLYLQYHDEEWGVPAYDDKHLFEMICLEGAQAGLSWITVLRKRENYRKAFDHFDAKKIVKYNAEKIEQLLQNEGIIRNKLKVNAFIKNAEAYLQVQKEWGSFSKYIWSFVNHQPIIHQLTTIKDAPAKTLISETMSKDLARRGFKFVGATICYAFMQACGMVDDHVAHCWKRTHPTKNKR
jgi:DNA-3-methyladenine glycosylase I